MSFLVQKILNDALIGLSDPGARSIPQDEQLSFYNRTAQKVAIRLNVIEYEAFFDHVANSDLYRLPDDCKGVRKMYATLTPSDLYSYWELKELFEDEHAQVTNRQTATGDTKHYFVRQGYFQLYPAPAATLVSGGRIRYWGLPPDVVDPTTETTAFPDVCRDLLTEGIIIHLLKRQRRLDEAQAREQEWVGSMTQSRDTFEDRGRDRRPNLRARGRFNSYFDGQV
jgi:hypothetical protein